MEILKELQKHRKSEKIAVLSENEKISYEQLWEKSEVLASYIQKVCTDDKRPVVVYGHKHPLMIIAFIACVKSGRAYVPVDINVPRNRVEDIIDSVQPLLILTTEELEAYEDYLIVSLIDNQLFCNTEKSIAEENWVKENDVYYIIFTSGSTGKPKGVQITYSSLNYFTEWILSLGDGEKSNKIYINQAPFSFDLSVMDLYMSLATESCLFTLDRKIQQDYKQLFQRLKISKANVWVSTPSFADLCLAEPGFSEDLLPDMERFLFCGETLTNKTAEKLGERFPHAEIYNTYGPTESTVAVTQILVTPEINRKWGPLPVGTAKPGTMIKIMSDEAEVPEGESGEIVIIGNTVSAGYFDNPAENQKAFFEYEKNGVKEWGYHTGDKGYMKEGLLFYEGRIDLQIKLHGYRMELEDIEENMMKVPKVEKAVVIPVCENGKVKYLKAFCIYGEKVENKRMVQKEIRTQMKQYVPEYMIPRKIEFINEIPMTNNGKADRKRLKEM